MLMVREYTGHADDYNAVERTDPYLASTTCGVDGKLSVMLILLVLYPILRGSPQQEISL